ncbi:hypothetical protein BHE74_00022927 [Ensete ventricosum]|nr:hypothetical protein GW17_00001034 [Ensete ventricosum]RWW69469.1 hypothetical protein BHE74_00022927 [Ensete ventricosum]
MNDRYAGKPIVSKYAEIASMLPQKTIRDVALRCQWMIVSPTLDAEMNRLIDENNRCLRAIARNLEGGMVCCPISCVFL